MKTLYFLPLAGLALCLASCDDDDITVKALPTPVVGDPEVTHNAASFTWDAVPGALQYGYELLDPEGHQVGADVTRTNSVSFSGLQPATDYVFNVWAYGEVYSENGTSERQSVSISTNPLFVLDAPVLEKSVNGPKTVFKWAALPDASAYRYTISQWDEEAGRYMEIADRVTPVCQVQFVCLPLNHYRLTVCATSDIDGYAANGSECAEEFEVTETRALKQSDFTGSFTLHTTGLEYVSSNGDSFDFTSTVKVSVIPGGTLSFPALYWSDLKLKATFDPATRTFTFPAQKWGESYIFAGYDSLTTPVIATLSADNNQIILSGWTGYYDNVYYFEQTLSTYTRQ